MRWMTWRTIFARPYPQHGHTKSVLPTVHPPAFVVVAAAAAAAAGW